MDKELELKLVEKYPVIFRDYGGDMRETCMAWGMTCGNGWYKLIDNLCQDIMDLIGDNDIEVIAEQVKEKFGGLRFYYSINYKVTFFGSVSFKIRDFFFRHRLGRVYWKIVHFRQKFWKSKIEKIEEVISEAELNSTEICEKCGKPGKRRGGGWVYTLCDECDKKLENDPVD